jgi:aryl-alcohol dehydrogenase-like predicted oxidoreductase
MEMRYFGNSEFAVPAVGMGTFQTFDVQGREAEKHCTRIVGKALSAGTNLFDSSPMYGESERVLAQAINGKRQQVKVATKVWSSSASEGRKQIRRALKWYENYVDVYQIHNLVAWREHLPFLEELRSDGKIKIIGITHYSHFSFSELMQVMQTGRIQQIQIPYNMADTMVEQEVLPLANELGIGVLVMRPLDQGMLVRQDPGPEKLKPLEKYGVKTWAQALLKWILSDFRVHCVIPATSKVERALENAEAGQSPWFDPEARAYVQKLSASTV